MKLSVGKRILMFFHWLFSLLICAAFAVYLIVPEFLMKYYNMAEQALGLKTLQMIGIGILAVYAILAIAQLILVFKRKKRSERGFITVDASDTGRVRIAVPAIEAMVRKAVYDIEGLSEMKISIDSKDDAIVIGVVATIVNGTHVPTITMDMQRSIRQFVEMNCGVAVRSVSVSINAVTNLAGPSRRRVKKAKKQLAAIAESKEIEKAAQEQAAAEKAAAEKAAAEKEAAQKEAEKAEEPAKEEPAESVREEREPEPEAPVFEREPEPAVPYFTGASEEPEVEQPAEKASAEPEPDPVEDEAEDVVAEESASKPEEEVGAGEEAGQPAEGYRFDKPYVMEFVKDLEAMRAKESESSDAEEPAGTDERYDDEGEPVAMDEEE